MSPLEKRRARIRDIRVTVAAAAAAAFLALFSGLYVQLARGHDPVLGAKVTATATATATPAATAATSTDDGTTAAADDGSAATQGTWSPAPMTTSQS